MLRLGDTEVLNQSIVALAVKERGDRQVVLIGSGISSAAAEGITLPGL